MPIRREPRAGFRWRAAGLAKPPVSLRDSTERRVRLRSAGEAECSAYVDEAVSGRLFDQLGDLIPLRSELDVVRLYTEIEPVRFESWVSVSEEIEPGAPAPVPPMLRARPERTGVHDRTGISPADPGRGSGRVSSPCGMVLAHIAGRTEIERAGAADRIGFARWRRLSTAHFRRCQ